MTEDELFFLKDYTIEPSTPRRYNKRKELTTFIVSDNEPSNHENENKEIRENDDKRTE